MISFNNGWCPKNISLTSELTNKQTCSHMNKRVRSDSSYTFNVWRFGMCLRNKFHVIFFTLDICRLIISQCSNIPLFCHMRGYFFACKFLHLSQMEYLMFGFFVRWHAKNPFFHKCLPQETTANQIRLLKIHRIWNGNGNSKSELMANLCTFWYLYTFMYLKQSLFVLILKIRLRKKNLRTGPNISRKFIRQT